MSTVSDRTALVVENALKRLGSGTPKTIHAALGEGSRVTVKHALIDLVAEGRVTFEGPDGRRLYRVAPAKAGS